MAKNAGTPWSGFPKAKGFFEMIEKWKEGLTVQSSFSEWEVKMIESLSNNMNTLLTSRQPAHPNCNLSKEEVDILLCTAKMAYEAFGGSDSDALPIDADLPLPFTGDQLLRSVEANAELMGVSDYVETMLIRIKALLSDARMKQIAGSGGNISEESLSDWLAS